MAIWKIDVDGKPGPTLDGLAKAVREGRALERSGRRIRIVDEDGAYRSLEEAELILVGTGMGASLPGARD